MNRYLEIASQPTLERIRRDQAKLPLRLRPLLKHLEENLFDPKLDASQLRRACGLGQDNGVPMVFKHWLGLPIYRYMVACRLEVAGRLLRNTDLKVWQIGQLLGYSSPSVFSRAFEGWSGLRPSVYRRQNKASEGLAWESICPETLQKALRGDLDLREVDELAEALSKMYPESFQWQGEPQVAATHIDRGDRL